MWNCRDVSYTTQPLELLNSLGFENSKKQTVLSKDSKASDAKDGGSPFRNNHKMEGGRALDHESLSADGDAAGNTIGTTNSKDDYEENNLQTNFEESDGLLLFSVFH